MSETTENHRLQLENIPTISDPVVGVCSRLIQLLHHFTGCNQKLNEAQESCSQYLDTLKTCFLPTGHFTENQWNVRITPICGLWERLKEETQMFHQFGAETGAASVSVNTQQLAAISDMVRSMDLWMLSLFYQLPWRNMGEMLWAVCGSESCKTSLTWQTEEQLITNLHSGWVKG